MTVFSIAWNDLKNKIEDIGKTSWGKNELKGLMYQCLHDAAMLDDRKEDLNDDLRNLLKVCSQCGMSGVDLLVYRCKDIAGHHSLS